MTPQDIAEGLNAISDNAADWAPSQIRSHAQALRTELDALLAQRFFIVQQGRYGQWDTTFNHYNAGTALGEFNRLRGSAPFLDYRLVDCFIYAASEAVDVKT